MTFRSAYNYGDMIPEQPFAEVYEWEYLDDMGKVVKQKINQYDMIQSVDYMTPPEIVAKGITDNGLDTNGNYGDFTDIPSDYNSLVDFVERLQSVISDYNKAQPKQGVTQTPETGSKPASKDTSVAGQTASATIKEDK